MQSDIPPEQVDAPLAYRVAHFCKSIGLGKTKFYELVARWQNQNHCYRRPASNPGR